MKYWTKENIMKEAIKYKNVTEYENNCSTAVNTARKMGWIEELKNIFKDKPIC